MRHLAAAILLATAPALADRREAYLLLEAGAGIQLLADPAKATASTVALVPAAELQFVYGLTNWVHLGLYGRGFVGTNVAFAGAQPTLADGSTPTGALYENLHGFGAGALLRLRANTGVLVAPFAQLELGGTWARFDAQALYPTGHDYALSLPVRDAYWLDGRVALGLELRLLEHLVLELVFAARRALTPYVPWQFDAGFAAGALW